MRILANENFPADAVTALHEAGHDVVWMRTAAPGSSDQAVLRHAQSEERVLITFDKISVNWPFEPNCLPQPALSCFVLPPRLPATWPAWP